MAVSIYLTAGFHFKKLKKLACLLSDANCCQLSFLFPRKSHGKIAHCYSSLSYLKPLT